MYKQNQIELTTINRNAGYPGETIETKVQKILNAKEPIKDGAPLIYTERKDGVLPSYNIKTDRFEVAVEAMGAIAKQHIAKRAGIAKVVPIEQPKEDTGGESIQATNNS